MFQEFNIEADCPKCSSSNYFGDFSCVHHGSAKLLFKCETNCRDCGLNKEYENSLQ